MSQEFLNRLKNYLDERLKGEVLYDSLKPFKIEVFPPSNKYWRWWVRTESYGVPVAVVAEHGDGTVSVKSDLLDKAGDDIIERLCKSYRSKFAKARGNKEEEEVWDALRRKEEDEARKDYLNRRNFEKHLKKSYWHAFLRLLWFDEVARRISEEHGVEVRVEIDKVDYESGLESKFDGSNMDEEKKFEEIRKRVEAVIAAYKLAHQAYHFREPKKREKFLEFRKANLAKYGIKR
ncbi:MAG: hypothetical protein FGF48_09160 [Candidatus Brockarchaeota archaeon]|nr:hypothetical protein [Candidatus Brockarchaeota archaeon]